MAYEDAGIVPGYMPGYGPGGQSPADEVDRDFRAMGITPGVTPKPTPAPTTAPTPAPAPAPVGLNTQSSSDYLASRRPPALSELGGYKLVGAPGFSTLPDAPKEGGSFLADAGRSIWQGVLGMGEGAVGGAEFVSRKLSGDSHFSNLLKEYGEGLKGAMRESLDAMSPERKAALSASMVAYAGHNVDADGNKIPTPGEVGWLNYFAMNGARLIPDALAMIIPYTAGAKLGVYALSKLGVATKAVDAATGLTKATTAAKVAGEVGANTAVGVVAGTEAAGETFNYLREEIEKATDEQMMTRPAYAELRKTMTEEQAKAATLEQAAPHVLRMFALGAGTSVGMSHLLMRGGVGGRGMGPLGRAAVGAAEGAGLNAAQGAGMSATQQAGQQDIGVRSGYDYGAILADAVSAGLPGAVLGGVGGLAHRRAPKVDEPPPAPSAGGDGVDPAQRAAVTYKTPAGPPEATLPPQPAPVPQGELFSPWEHGPTVGVPEGPPVPPGAQPGDRTQFPPSTAPIDTGLDRTPGYNAPQPPSYGMTAEGPVMRNAGEPPPSSAAPGPAQGEMFAEAGPAPPPPVEAPGIPLPAAAPARASTRGSTPTPVTSPAVAAQADRLVKAITTSKARSKSAPASPESTGMTAAQLRDELRTMPNVDPATLKGMTHAQLAATRDRVMTGSTEAAPPDATTVVTPATAESSRQASAAAAPPAPGTSLPPAPEGTQPLTAKNPEVRPDGGAARREGESLAQSTTAPVTEKPAVTKAEAASTKRAAQKAKMAGGTTVEQAAAHIDETTRASKGTREEYEAEQRAAAEREARVERDVAAAADRANASVDDAVSTIKINSNLPAFKRAIRELIESIGQSDGTMAMLRTNINKWADRQTGNIPGTNVGWDEIANRVHLDVTGEARGRTSEAFAQSAAGDVARQPEVDDSKTSRRIGKEEMSAREADDAHVTAPNREVEAPEPDTDGGTRKAVDETPAPSPETGDAHESLNSPKPPTEPVKPPAEKPAVAKKTTGGGDDAPKTTDITVKAKHLVRKLLNREMPPETADRLFGQPVPGRGAERREGYRNLAEVIRNLITKAEDKDLEAAILRKLGENENSKTGTPQQRAATRKSLEAQLDETGEQRASDLRDILKRLSDPAGYAADKADQLSERARLEGEMAKDASSRGVPLDPITPDGISPRSSRAAAAANDERLSGGLLHAIEAAKQRGEVPTVHQLLRVIVNDTMVSRMMQPFRRLAQVLLKRADDLPVMHVEDAYESGRIDLKTYNLIRDRAFGAFDPNTNTLLLNHDYPRSSSTHAETFLHEVMHSVTFNYLDNLLQTNRNHKDILALRVMMNEMRRHADAHYDGMNFAEVQRVFGAVKDVHEFHTVLMSSPTAQAFAAAMRASPEFLARMRTLDMPARPGQSVWRSFTDWVRKALGLEPAKSASEQTFLDHIMRPLSDITERAHEFNKRDLPSDPAVRGRAEPLYDGIMSGFGSRVRDASERADLPGLGARVRGALLSTAPWDRLRDRYGRLFQDGEHNAMHDVQRALERQRVTGGEYIKRHGDATNEVVRALKGKDQLAELMNDAGYARAALGDVDAKANEHLTTPDEIARLNELQARFKALPKADQELYAKTRDLMSRRYADERNAHVDGLINRFMPEATPDEKDFMRKALRTQDALAKFLADPDAAPIAAEHRLIARKLADVRRNMGFVQGDYFPMRRFGDWVVEYGGDKDTPTYGVQFFESRAKAEAFRRDLLSRDEQVQSVRQRREVMQSRSLSPAAEELMTVVSKNDRLKDHAEELRNLLTTLQLQYASGAERSRAKRRRIAGASKDVARAIESDLAAASLRVGRAAHMGERDAALLRMKYHSNAVARAGNKNAALMDQVIAETRRRFDAGEDAAYGGASGLAGKVTSFGYAHALMSFSRLATETAEMHLRMGAFIGARHGAGRAGLELARAMRDISPKLFAQGVRNTAKAFMGKPLSSVDYDLTAMAKDRLLASGHNKAEVEAFFKHFHENGLFDQTQAMALRELARPSNMGKAWNWFIDVSSAMSHASDETSRIAGAWAAFRADRSKGGTVHDALRFAEDTLRKAPNFAPENRPRIATERGILGKWGAPIMQFKLYGLNEHWLLANLARDVISRSTDPAVRKEAILALTGTVMAHSMMAGVLTWYADPARYLGGLYDLLTGQKPQDRMLTARKWLSDTIGPTAGELVGRGAVRALGIDVSQRLGVQNMLNIPELNGFTPKDWAGFVGELAMGAGAESGSTAATGLMKAMQGDILGGAKDALPRILRDPLKAYELSSKGVEDSRGKQVLAPDKITTGDVISQAVGFTPSRVAEARAGRRAVMQARDRLHDERGKLTSDWIEAEPEDRGEVWERIREWNADPANAASRITRQQLLQTLHQRQKDERREGAFGLRLPRKGAQQLIDAGSFATP